MRSKTLITVFSWLTFFLVTGTALGGEAPLPFWSQLTPFEIRTLQRIELALSGDADTLLALALIASGDIRDQKAYHRIKKRVHRFVQAHRTDIGTEKTVYARGEKLLHAMHAGFFAGGGKGRNTELIGGYNEAQSRVSGIFHNGRFNCISSAILYMVLARYFELDVEGVIMPQHAFVQIRGENGRPIEVETTSNYGYDLTHDAEFYRNRFTRFSLSRNLPVPTYADYLKRQVLPPYRLIAENMNTQHTAKARMEASDRQRLSEMTGYLDPDTAASQLIRLNALHNACIRLVAKNKETDADRMFSVVQHVLRHVQSRDWIHHTQRPEIVKIWDRIGAIHLMLGHLHMKTGRLPAARHQYTRAVKWAREKNLQKQAKISVLNSIGHEAFDSHRWNSAIETYLKLLPHFDAADDKQINTTHENIATAYWNWANAAGNKGNWAQAVVRYGKAAHWTRNRNTKKRAMAAKADAEARLHMQNGEWEAAIRKLKTIQSRQDKSGGKVVQTNIGSAYISWGNTLFNQQDYNAAIDKYEAALDVLEGEKQNLVIRNIAAAYHNLTLPYLKTQHPERAVDVLKSGIDRFPTCGQCRLELQNLQMRLEASAMPK